MSSESHHHSVAPTTTASEPDQDQGAGPGYEVRDTNVRSIGIFIASMFIALLLTEWAMWVLLKSISGGKPETADSLARHENAGQQREILRRQEDALLNAKDDPSQISIDEAIERIARTGLRPTTGPARTEVEVNSHAGLAAPVTEPKKDEPAPSRKGETR